jgi:hypothetical protein
MDLDLPGLINDELARIKSLAVSIVSVARAADDGELEDLPYNVHPLNHIEELATLILEQENEIREILEDAQAGIRGPIEPRGAMQPPPTDQHQ